MWIYDIILFSERLKMDSSVMPDDEDGGEKNTYNLLTSYNNKRDSS